MQDWIKINSSALGCLIGTAVIAAIVYGGAYILHLLIR